MSSESKPSGVVFGSCNKNFLRYRKFRYWDSKKEAICLKDPDARSHNQPLSEVPTSNFGENSISNLPPSGRTKSMKWTFKNKNLRNCDAQDNASNNTEVEDAGTTKLKRQLTRGSSEKLMLVNRFKKHSEQSPDRGSWRPRLSLRRKSCSLDETVSKSEKY